MPVPLGLRFFLPGHVGEFFGSLDGLRRGFGHFEVWVRFGCFAGFGFVRFPGGDAGLHPVMFGGGFVAGFHVEQREVGVDELFAGFHFFGFVAFGDGGSVIAFAIVGHAERELGVEMVGVGGEDGFELFDGAVVIGRAEIEHGVVVLVLEAHSRGEGKPFRFEFRVWNIGGIRVACYVLREQGAEAFFVRGALVVSCVRGILAALAALRARWMRVEWAFTQGSPR